MADMLLARLRSPLLKGIRTSPNTSSRSSSFREESEDGGGNYGSTNPKQQKLTPIDRDVEKPGTTDLNEPTWSPTKRFRISFSLICFIFVLSAFEASVVGNVLPSVASELQLGNSYIWGSIAFLLASTIIQPFFAQIQDPFGRKNPLLMGILIFAVGSACCGAAENQATFLAGRTIQGLGTSGIDLIGETVIGDLVPLRYRPKWFGIKQAIYAAGSLLGPVLGGVFTQKVSWRWVFYMNIPLCCVSSILIAFFLRLEHPPLGGIRQKMKKVLEMDLLGIAFLAIALTLLTISLTNSKVLGCTASIVEFAVGGVFLLTYFVWEKFSPICQQPFMPARLWTKFSTSLIGFVNIFIWGATAYGTQLVLPIHLQAVQGDDPMKAGYEMLPITALLVIFSGISGHLLSKWGSKKGAYKWMQLGGFLLQTLGTGLLIPLNSKSSPSMTFCAMITCAAGCGISIPSTLPAIMVELDDADNAVATGNWAFLRNIGAVVGALLPAVFLNSQTLQAAERMQNEVVQAELLQGGLWNKASAEFLGELPAEMQPTVKDMFSAGLKWTFVTFTVALGVSVILTLCLKSLPMRDSNETNFGLQNSQLENDTTGDDEKKTRQGENDQGHAIRQAVEATNAVRY